MHRDRKYLFPSGWQGQRIGGTEELLLNGKKVPVGDIKGSGDGMVVTVAQQCECSFCQ